MQQKPNRKKLFISIFIIAVMVLSTFAIILSSFAPEQDQLEFNGFKFKVKNRQFITEVNDKEYIFYLHPTQILSTIPSEAITAIQQNPSIIISFEPNATQPQFLDTSRLQLERFLTLDLQKSVENAIIKPSTVYQLPVKTCTKDANFYIVFTESNETLASFEDNCLALSASRPVDFLIYSEELIYKLLGII